MKPSERIHRILGENALKDGTSYQESQTVALVMVRNQEKIINAIVQYLDEQYQNQPK